MIRRLLVAPLLALVFTGAAPGGASASCAGPLSLPDQIQAAALVFVGTVQSTSDGDRVAQVVVESIWKGPSITAYVDVHGSPVSGPSVSSVDRRYQAGTRYLFVLYSADQPLQDNSCSGTQPYTGALAELRPAGARPPITVGYPYDPTPAAGRYLPALVGVILIAAAAIFVTVAVRLRSKR